MNNEVSKLIYNALIKHQILYLPEVGTLRVVRYSATMSSKNEVIPPRYDIEYSSGDCAKSLIDIISSEVGVDINRAEEIYLRWLDKAREGSVVVIDRVGELRDKSFVVDKELVDALNLCREPLRVIRRKSNALLYTILALILVAAIGGGAWWYFNSMTEVNATAEKVINEETTSSVEIPLDVENKQSELDVVNDVNIAKEIEVSEDTDVIIEEENIVEQIEPTEDSEVAEEVAEFVEVVEAEVVVEDVVTDWRTRDDIRHWVVVGSYSTTANAERAIADIMKRMPQMQCNYFKLGSMYAVAAFGSADSEECQEFKRAYVKEFEQSWVYTPKKFR